ncbi:hypothetical protein FHS16_001984 [Paenibacillus endophyticus]|uniref:Uncharacterized protein n=1 Tax=Paenibacillus endophyticus TaxID=1294268 RepID=A0A7W5C683_9BACL|nr:hypothetical protein [Paenibacillus endophyticus]MBB3151938.1 hypothetical protein [Paenibacillus endophyticus]
MAIITNGRLILPGTAFYGLLKSNQGQAIKVTTSNGIKSGALLAFNANFLTLANATGETTYVLTSELITFSFPS